MNKKWIVFSAIMNTILMVMDTYLFIAYLFVFFTGGELVNLTCSLLSLTLVPFWTADLLKDHRKLRSLKKNKDTQEGE